MPWERAPSPSMEPDPPSLLRRMRWGNVAWALAALAAIGLVLAWPHLQRRSPRLPDATAPAPGAPAPPVTTARPNTLAPSPQRHVAPARHRRRAQRPHARRADRVSRRRARRPRPPPVPPLDPPASSSPEDTAPAPPAGDQEFLPG